MKDLESLVKEDGIRRWKEVKEFIEKNDAFFIFGSGIAGHTVKNYLTSLNKDVVGFIDNDPSKMGSYIDEIKVYSPVILEKEKIPIIVSSGWFIEIAHQLENEFGLQCGKEFFPFYAYEWFLSHTHIGKEFFDLYKASYDEISFLMEYLADEFSKNLLSQIIWYRSLFLNPERIKEEDLPVYYQCKTYERKSLLYQSILALKEKNCYTHYALSRNYRTIIEAGAYIGDTAILFSELYPEAKIYSFEPSLKNFEALIENVSGRENIVPLNFGLWSLSGKAKISINPVNPRTNKIDMINNGDIKLISIDEFVESENIKPDLIKLDIEGAEMEALKGATNTLSRYYPDLIIAIYHKGSDLWEIPLFILRNFPQYKLYIHHSDVFISSTVVVASRS